MSDVEKKVWETVQAMNRAWTVERTPEKLQEFFHRDMVAVPGNERTRREGGAACAEGWGAFTKVARVISWEEREPKVQLWADGKTAVVNYYYYMVCEMNGRKMKFSGRETYVLVNEDGRWWIVAEHFSEFPG